MANFTLALPYVLAHEGGFVDDPADSGGATNMGVTLAVAQRYGIGTVDELKAITVEKVAQIYRADYWRFNGIDDQRVATKMLDMAVNMGLAAASKLAQGTLNGIGAAIAVDGQWGMMSQTSLNAVDPAKMLTLLVSASAAKYRAIAQARPTSMRFLDGWLRRAYEVPA